MRGARVDSTGALIWPTTSGEVPAVVHVSGAAVNGRGGVYVARYDGSVVRDCAPAVPNSTGAPSPMGRRGSTHVAMSSLSIGTSVVFESSDVWRGNGVRSQHPIPIAVIP
ncbi:MAG: hypothetical protein AAF726_15000 [Planctomycetota bacterium]